MTRAAIWDRIDRSGACWLWTGAKTTAGYGVARLDGRNRYVHRTVYEMLVGPIPPGLEADHLCRNTGCVNPRHVELVTHRVNIRRGKAAVRAAATHCRRGHLLTADSAFIRADGARCCRQCSRRRRL